jgi:hypothetical protein
MVSDGISVELFIGPVEYDVFPLYITNPGNLFLIGDLESFYILPLPPQVSYHRKRRLEKSSLLHNGRSAGCFRP